MAGIGPTLVNMALSGIVGMTYILLVGGDLEWASGGRPAEASWVCGIRQASRNITRYMIRGAPGIRGQAPWTPPGHRPQGLRITRHHRRPFSGQADAGAHRGRFGWHWGIVAGFIDTTRARCRPLPITRWTHRVHLYNNGFAAGIVASVLVPVIIAINRAPSPTDASRSVAGGTGSDGESWPRKPPRIGRRRRSGVEQPSITTPRRGVPAVTAARRHR